MSTIQLLRKAGLVIDELAKSSSTPAELAKALDEPRSSVYRIVASLEETGYIRQSDGGRLELGAAILKLGDSAASALVNRHGLRQQLRWKIGRASCRERGWIWGGPLAGERSK